MFHLLSHAVHQPLQALDIIIGVILFVAALALLLVPDLAVKVVAVLVMTPCVLAMIYIGDPLKRRHARIPGSLGHLATRWPSGAFTAMATSRLWRSSKTSGWPSARLTCSGESRWAAAMS